MRILIAQSLTIIGQGKIVYIPVSIHEINNYQIFLTLVDDYGDSR